MGKTRLNHALKEKKGCVSLTQQLSSIHLTNHLGLRLLCIQETLDVSKQCFTSSVVQGTACMCWRFALKHITWHCLLLLKQIPEPFKKIRRAESRDNPIQVWVKPLWNHSYQALVCISGEHHSYQQHHSVSSQMIFFLKKLNLMKFNWPPLNQHPFTAPSWDKLPYAEIHRRHYRQSHNCAREHKNRKVSRQKNAFLKG